jgi:hypothetical protein
MKKTTIVLLMIVISSCLTFSQDFKPEVKIGAVLFTGWEFNMDNAQFISKLDTSSAGVNPDAAFGYNPTKNQFEVSKNSFFLERAYINVLASLTPQIKARITPDVQPVAGTTNQYFLLVKYANIYYTPLQKDNGMSLAFGLGILPNRWIEKNEGYWGYRGIAKTLTDYTFTTGASRTGNTVTQTTGSYFSSADLGADIVFTAPKGYAELYADIFNGNGYKNLSFDNRFKDFEVTALIHPLAGQISKRMDVMKKAKKERIDGITDLTIGGFMYLGKLANGENYTVNPTDGQVATQFVRNRFGGMAHLRYNFKNAGYVNVGGEFSLQANQDPAAKIDSVAKTNSTGISAYLEINPPVKSIDEKLMLIARYDMFDPNTDNSNTSTTSFNNNTDKQSLLILALAFKPAKILTLAASYQAVTYQSQYVVKYDGTTSKTDSRFILHGILNF